jgi:hypothetical protein
MAGRDKVLEKYLSYKLKVFLWSVELAKMLLLFLKL